MPGATEHAISVTIEPDWARWRSAIEHKRESPARAELGLDTERSIVFSGHQPIVFHNGILAKLIAQHEAARRTGAARVWIVPDQDPVNPGTLRVPVGAGELLHLEIIDLLAPTTAPQGTPTASAAPEHIESTHDPRLHALIDHLNQHARAGSLAEQFAHATIALACERLGIEPPTLLFASHLTRSDTLRKLIQRMLDEPQSCVTAYNEAVGRHAHAGVRTLTIGNGAVELPLWGLRSGRARVGIDTNNIKSFDSAQLAPRGLLMSLLVRAHLGELFIHGAGGWRYDKITQDWARDWLGIELAPMALATATQRLDLGFAPEQIIDPARAVWAVHHARHNPAAVGDTQAQISKDELVERIETLRAEGGDPSPAFRELHELLDRFRTAHADGLEVLDGRMERAKRMQRQLELAADRTWPFVLFDDRALNRLRDAVVSALR